MNRVSPNHRRDTSIVRSRFVSRRRIYHAVIVLLIALASSVPLAAQQKTARPQKFPSADKIVGDYLKAIGGKKRLAAIKDATYEWSIQLKEQSMGSALTQQRAPTSARTDMRFGNGEINSGVSSRSAWTRGLDGKLRTLTDAEAGSAKLKAALEASRFVDYKKLYVLARTILLDETGSEPAHVVEFSTRAGARLLCWFGTRSKLLVKAADETRKPQLNFGDYRQENGVLEPHRVEMANGGEAITLLLQSVHYNTGLDEAVFDPPAAETPDIAQLLREVEENQKKIDERISNYAFTEKRTERKVNDKGEVKEEKVIVYEIFPLPGGGAFYKVISENGVPLSAERAAKQDKKIEEDVARYEAAREKREQKKKEEAEKNPEGAKGKKDDDDVTVAVFLRACEFISPRRESLRDREAVVFDFRPRPGFKPKNMAEGIVTKLIGVVWIDPVDKEVIRLEAKLSQSFKIAGGLFASIKPGSAFAFEQTRMADGVWLPRYAQINFAAKVLLFKSIETNQTSEFSDYRRFNTEATDYKLGAPAGSTAAPPKP